MPSHILNSIGEDPHAYDDVAAEPKEVKADVEEVKKQQPVRKAPPVPPPPPPVHQQEQSGEAQEQEQPRAKKSEQTTNLPSDQRSNHSYEEIAASELAVSEVASEVCGIFRICLINIDICIF